jgi:hypothetical protein
LKIFWVFCVYNEIELLPFKIDFIRKNKIDCYVFDNMSTDGSWEWLQRNGVPSDRFDSDGMFDLILNLRLIINKIHEVRPDWAMFGAPDTFYAHLKCRNLREVIEKADQESFTMINDTYRLMDFMFTGLENGNEDPRVAYRFFSGKTEPNVVCIARYTKDLSIDADQFKSGTAKILYDENFFALHYGLRHDGKERKMNQYARREKAWDAGRTPIGWGSHYKGLIDMGEFICKKDDLSDVREHEIWEQLKNSVMNG